MWPYVRLGDRFSTVIEVNLTLSCEEEEEEDDEEDEEDARTIDLL